MRTAPRTVAPRARRIRVQIDGVFAEFERSVMRERVNAGLARARANAKRLAPFSPEAVQGLELPDGQCPWRAR
ncbi:MAG: recombinase family protein [SAR324 cluster bacterium]